MKRIPLGKDKYTLVDDEDYEWAKSWHWYLTHDGYVHGRQRSEPHRSLSRLIMKAPKHLQVDHKNHDLLDNRKDNLRLCTPAQNTRHRRKTPKLTTSVYKGVYWAKPQRMWRAAIRVNGKRTYLGFFDQEHHAAMAYDIWAKDIYREFAVLNFN